MSAKNQTQVVINGQIFVISGYESEEYIQKVGYYLNNKLTEIQKLESYKRQSNDMKSILVQLNIADDYFKAKKQAEIFEQDLQQKDQEMYELKHELIALRMKIEETEKKEQDARTQKELLEGKVKELEKEIDKLLK